MKKLTLLLLCLGSLYAEANPLDRVMSTTNGVGSEISNTTKMVNTTQNVRGDNNLINTGILIRGADIYNAKVTNYTEMKNSSQSINGHGNVINNGIIVE